jgi:hypothetical protein
MGGIGPDMSVWDTQEQAPLKADIDKQRTICGYFSFAGRTNCAAECQQGSTAACDYFFIRHNW